MYVVTFYSYKGGVGRTLALVNVAFDLSERGKRVLLVDFDLEAPGLPSYQAFSGIRKKPGLVDYVTEYLASNAAPDVREYIFPSDDPNIFVMPAGNGGGGRLRAMLVVDRLDAVVQGTLRLPDVRGYACTVGCGFSL